MSLLYSRLFTSLSPAPTAVPSVVSLARQWQSRLNSSCYFTDVDYLDQSRDVWATADHMARLLTMTQALTAPSSPLLNDSTLSVHVHCGLQVWCKRGFTNPNWWWNVIGIPLNAASMLLLLSVDRLSPAEVTALSRLTFNADWWVDDWGGGANLVWEIQIQVYRGVTTRNLTALEQGYTRMWQDVVVQPLNLEGVMRDWSYHFHGAQLLNGAYGAVWTADILSFALTAQGTAYALNASQAVIVAQFIAEGNAWMTVGSTWDFPAIGRSVDRPGAGGPSLGFSAAALRQFSALAPTFASALTDFADRIEGKSGAAALIGHRHFYTSDYAVARREGWVVGLKLHSVRTVPTECDNFENLKGEHLGDGVLNVYPGGQLTGQGGGGAYEDIFPLLDWHLLNGVTCEADTPLLYCGPETGDIFQARRTAFVGGVSDGQLGLATMDTATHNLTGHRSWVFLPQGVLALMSNLTDPTPAEVRTTLHSRVIATKGVGLTVGWTNGSHTALPDGRYMWPPGVVQWLHAGGVGYVVDGGVEVGADVGVKVGNYATIGPNNHTVTKRTATSWLSHGRALQGATAGYTLLPNVTAEEMGKARNTGVDCVVMEAGWHAAGVPDLRRAWLVVYPGAAGAGRVTWKCDGGGWNMQVTAGPGLYMVEEDEGGFTVSAAMPVAGTKSGVVTVNRGGEGEGCVWQANQTAVTVVWPTGSLLGQSVQRRCNSTRGVGVGPLTLSNGSSGVKGKALPLEVLARS